MPKQTCVREREARSKAFATPSSSFREQGARAGRQGTRSQPPTFKLRRAREVSLPAVALAKARGPIFDLRSSISDLPPGSAVSNHHCRAFRFRHAPFAFDTDGESFDLRDRLIGFELNASDSVRSNVNNAGTNRVLMSRLNSPELIIAARPRWRHVRDCDDAALPVRLPGDRYFCIRVFAIGRSESEQHGVRKRIGRARGGELALQTRAINRQNCTKDDQRGGDRPWQPIGSRSGRSGRTSLFFQSNLAQDTPLQFGRRLRWRQSPTNLPRGFAQIATHCASF